MLANAKPKLISGSPFGVEGQIDVDPAKLLRKVVTAVINHGQAHILHEFPDVLAFFGARIPQAHAKKVAASESSSDALTKLDQREEA